MFMLNYLNKYQYMVIAICYFHLITSGVNNLITYENRNKKRNWMAHIYAHPLSRPVSSPLRHSTFLYHANYSPSAG